MPEPIRYKTTDEVDFVIIGSGAAGGVLAKELSTNGFRVVVLEQGPYLTEAEYLDGVQRHAEEERAAAAEAKLTLLRARYKRDLS